MGLVEGIASSSRLSILPSKLALLGMLIISLSVIVTNAAPASSREIVLPDVRPLAKSKTGTPRLVSPTEKPPISGFAPDSYHALDDKFTQLMNQYDIPGASLCIAQNGKIIFSRGYGWADTHKRIPVTPDKLFRIASISKSITAVAIAKLCEQEKLQESDAVFSVLHYPWPSGTKRDPRLHEVTIQNLLQCTGGWNRDAHGDPLFTPHVKQAAQEFSHTLRPEPDSIIRYWLGRDLDFVPGSHFAYSNFGYTLLGRVIEQVTGQPYSEYVRKNILMPMGITDMQSAKTYELEPNEVIYYPFAGQEKGPSIFPNFREKVPVPYGSNFSLEAMRADSGWLASSPDLVKFVSSLFGERSDAPSPISRDTLDNLLKWPDVPEWKNPKSGVYFAKGWQVVPAKKGKLRVVYREGCLAGSVSVLMHRDDGISWCFLLNSRPQEFRKCQAEMAKTIWECVNKQPNAR